jgi:hypothetical protein
MRFHEHGSTLKVAGFIEKKKRVISFTINFSATYTNYLYNVFNIIK